MRSIQQTRSLRFVFAANLISMLGSGMNSAAVAWTILQRTHSEMALGTFAALQTIPAMLMLPFTGVIIDREDRRRLVMWLDAGRAVVILVVTVLAFLGHVQVWELYLMNTLVAAGFWMFWPTITALIQELTPEGEFVKSNTFLLAGIQGGWLIAGAIVGFVYEHIGLGGVLLIDVSTYVVSFSCYFAVRQGRHVVPRAVELRHDLEAAETAVGRFLREMREGLVFLREHRSVVFLGTSWALFLGAMMTGVVVTAPLSDRVFHAGSGRVPERSLCSGADCADGGTLVDCVGDVAADFYDGTFAVCPMAGAGGITVWVDGIGARRQRRGHEYQPDGASAATVYGTCPEYFLFLWHVSAGGARAGGGLGCIADQPGGRVWRDCRGVRGRIWQRLLADSSSGGGGFSGGVGS